jgi:predicted porin
MAQGHLGTPLWLAVSLWRARRAQRPPSSGEHNEICILCRGHGGRFGPAAGGLTDSLWGLQGAEDLGAGWRSRFQLESGFDPSGGNAADVGHLFNYAAWVGIGHDSVGELRLGRQPTIGQRYGNALEIASWKDMGMGATFKASDNF